MSRIKYHECGQAGISSAHVVPFSDGRAPPTRAHRGAGPHSYERVLVSVMADMTPEAMLENARRVAREQYRAADAMSYMDALPPLRRVMEALGIELDEDAPGG